MAADAAQHDEVNRHIPVGDFCYVGDSVFSSQKKQLDPHV